MQNNIIIKNIISDIGKAAEPQRIKILQKFFQTGKGEYGEGQIFIGLRVPTIRKIFANHKKEVNIDIAFTLLKNEIHEIKLFALYALVYIYKNKSTTEKEKREIFDLYIKNIKDNINNWDLVDTSCRDIVGDYCMNNNLDEKLFDLIKSKNLWERRVGVVSTFYYIMNGKDELIYKMAIILKEEPHHLMHKAIGWMMREAGKRVSRENLIEFLREHHNILPSITRSYAMEHLNYVEKHNIRNLHLS